MKIEVIWHGYHASPSHMQNYTLDFFSHHSYASNQYFEMSNIRKVYDKRTGQSYSYTFDVEPSVTFYKDATTNYGGVILKVLGHNNVNCVHDTSVTITVDGQVSGDPVLTNLGTSAPSISSAYTIYDYTGVSFDGSGNATFAGTITAPMASSFNNTKISIHNNRINSGYDTDSDDLDIWINYEGYNNAAGYFRDFRVGDGKNAQCLLIDGSSKAATFAGTVTVNTAGSSIAQESWNEVTPSSPFSNYGSDWDTCAYMKDSNGVVHLKGLVTGDASTGSRVIFTLPSGYRPSKARMFATMWSGSPDEALRVDISANNGNVTIDTHHNGWVSLNEISFKI